MDLSQQELPLTTYFSRGSKELRSHTLQYKKNKSSEDLQSVARSSKRRRSNVQCSTASPLGSFAGQPKSRPNTLQLPTPATSARKRTRNGRLEVQAETGLTSTSALSSSAGRSASEDLTQLDYELTPSKVPPPSRENAPLSGVPLATPSTHHRRQTKPIDVESPGPRQSNHAEAGMPTPRTLSRSIPEPVRGVDDHSSPARSSCRLPVEPGSECAVSHAVLSHAQHPVRPSADLPCSPVDSNCPDPFRTPGKNLVPQPLDGAFVPPRQYLFPSKTLDGQPSDRRAVPTIPVPSSQSQYLLHLDATPKRKRCSQSIEHVISSQTQEERELTLSMPLRPTTLTGSSVGVSLGKYMENASVPRITCGERKPHHVYTLGSSPVGSPISSPSGSSHPFFLTKKAPDVHLSQFARPSRRERSTLCHSPCRKAKAHRKSPRLNSIENIPSAHMEDSLTESESESDILQMTRATRLHTTLNSALQETNLVPSHAPMTHDVCPPSRECAEGSLPEGEDDSATEAESDTEILHCVAEISRKRPHGHCPEVSRRDISPPSIVSPLVSPARPHIAAAPPIVGSTRFVTQEDARSDVPGPRASYPASIEQPRIPSESLPSVVLEFIRMFPGDESYPADFPQSLRI